MEPSFLQRERETELVCVDVSCIMCILAHIYWSIALDFLTPFSTVSQSAYSHTNAPSVLIECQCCGCAATRFYLIYQSSISWKYFIFLNFLPVSCTLTLHYWVRKDFCGAPQDCRLRAEWNRTEEIGRRPIKKNTWPCIFLGIKATWGISFQKYLPLLFWCYTKSPKSHLAPVPFDLLF